MRIALASPVFLRPLAPWLDVDDADQLPRGYGHSTATHLALALLGEGHDLEVVALDPSVTTPQRHLGPRLGLQIGPYRPSGRARDGFRVERRFITQALRAVEPDLVHAHWTYEYALGALAAGAPTLVTVNDWAPTVARLVPDPYRAVRLLMHAVTVARAPSFTAPSPHIAARVARWRGVDVPVIPHGLPEEAFRREAAHPRPGPPTILAVNSGFSALKNVKALLRAFPLVRDRIPGATLRLVGTDYEAGGPAARWAGDHGLGEGVAFLGVRPDEDLRALLGEADLFVHPSLEESFGMVVAEAMAARVPVVAGARSGAVPWLLEQGRAGVLTDVRDPRSLSRAMRRVLEGPALWRRCSERGYGSARRRFRLPAAVRSYEEQYERLLAGSAPSTRGRPARAGRGMPRTAAMPGRRGGG